jgi:hypothetical protein
MAFDDKNLSFMHGTIPSRPRYQKCPSPHVMPSFSRQVGHLSRRFSDQLGNLSDGYCLSLDVVSII